MDFVGLFALDTYYCASPNLDPNAPSPVRHFLTGLGFGFDQTAPQEGMGELDGAKVLTMSFGFVAAFDLHMRCLT